MLLQQRLQKKMLVNKYQSIHGCVPSSRVPVTPLDLRAARRRWKRRLLNLGATACGNITLPMLPPTDYAMRQWLTMPLATAVAL